MNYKKYQLGLDGRIRLLKGQQIDLKISMNFIFKLTSMA